MINIQKKIADIYLKEQLAQVYRTEAELTRYYGNHTLAFFGLAPENLHFLTPGGTGLVNYRLVRNVAVVPGDPVCAPEAFEQVTRSFLDFCALQHWHVAFYQASPEHLTTYRALQLRAFKMGEEAILHPQTFTLDGSAMANVRISARRAERDEVVIHWHEGVPPVEMMHQLEQISDAWLERRTGHHPSEMGFSMGRLDELIDIADRADRVASISPPSNGSHRAAPRVVTEVATTSSGNPCAFVTFIPVYGSLTPNATTTSNQSEVLSTNPSLQQHCESCNGSCQRRCASTDCVRQARPKEVSELSQLANEASPLPLRGQASCKAYGSPEASMRGVGTNPSLQRHCVSTASPSAAMQGEGWGWSLDLMRRAPDAPPGVMELLLVRAIERFQSCGAQIVSLGMVAMADTRQEMTPAQRWLVNFITDRLHLLESRRTLFNFKQKFHPRWESRYIVTNTTLALPKIALAVLRLRNYSGGRLARLITR